MCISLGRAEFESTRILVAEKAHPVTGQTIHTTFYGVDGKDAALVPNSPGRAISLNVPSRNPLGPENFITIPEINNDFLKRLERSYFSDPEPQYLGGGISRGFFGGALVFEHGNFTIVSAQNANEIMSALDQVPDERRAPVDPELLEFYATHYPDFSFAMAFWNAKEGTAKIQIAYQYEPLNPSRLFFPAVDNQQGRGIHTGGAPLNTEVKRNQMLMWGTDRGYEQGAGIDLSTRTADPKNKELAVWIPETLFGTRGYKGETTENGDFEIAVDDPRMAIVGGPFAGINMDSNLLSGSEADFMKLRISKPLGWA